jgi:hypothetical protein
MPTQTIGFGGDVFDLVLRAGPMGKLVLLILLGFSVASWAIIIHKWRLMRRIKRETHQFREIFAESDHLPVVYAATKQYHASPLARMDDASLSTRAATTADASTTSVTSGRGRGAPRSETQTGGCRYDACAHGPPPREPWDRGAGPARSALIADTPAVSGRRGGRVRRVRRARRPVRRGS